MIHVNSFLWIEWSLKHREKIETGGKGLLTPTVLRIPEKSPVFYAFGSNWTRCVCSIFFSFLFAISPLEVSRPYGCPGVRSWKLDFCIWKRNIQVFWWWGTREPLMLCGHLSETFLWSTFDLYVIIFIFSITTG